MRSLLRTLRPTKRRVAALSTVPVAIAVTVTATQVASADELGAAATGLTVMDWNIHGKGADISAMADLVNSHGIDVLTVQEIQRAKRDQVKDLADELRWYTSDLSDHTHFSQADRPGPCDAEESGWVGNAVLSKYPIAERVTVRLSPKDQGCPVQSG
ncbi:MAG: hypothetical protein GEV07_29795 [Streptosporangiales bacterium]|nr:hypothetical protein [Streptosporangiales bacterium]